MTNLALIKEPRNINSLSFKKEKLETDHIQTVITLKDELQLPQPGYESLLDYEPGLFSKEPAPEEGLKNHQPLPHSDIDPQYYRDLEAQYGEEIARELIFAKMLGYSITTTLIHFAADRATQRAVAGYEALAAEDEARFDRAKADLQADIDAIVQSGEFYDR
jgi:hypothetical protein